MPNEQLIARFEAVSDEINRRLEDSPEISDIDDNEFKTEDLENMVEANFSLLVAVRQRQHIIQMVADQVRSRRKCRS